jgi:hypothetical protein
MLTPNYAVVSSQLLFPLSEVHVFSRPVLQRPKVFVFSHYGRTTFTSLQINR